MDIELKGFIEDMQVSRFPEDGTDLVKFKLVDRSEHAIVKGLKCYMIPRHEVTDLIEKLDTEKEYIVSGVICSTEDGVTDFQVHRLYEVPKYIWG